jgi:RNA polymerase sigma-70 factor, ECF subfamily
VGRFSAAARALCNEFSSTLPAPGATKSLPDLGSTLSLVFQSLILSASVLTKVAALVEFNRLDIVPAFRQIFPGTPIAKMPVTLRIPYSASHFRVVLVMCWFWLRYCSLDDWQLLEQMPRRYGVMATFLATDIEKDPDHALVTAATRGDTHAFEKLVSRHKRRVFAVALRVTKNREDAEDVVQESFHKAFLHIGSFQQASQFSTRLNRIAFNESYTLLRRRRRAPEVLPLASDDGVNLVPEAFVDLSPDPEESCRRREHSELLTNAINRLGPTIRKTMWLRMVEERSVEETAQMLDTSVAAVKSCVFRGRRELSGTLSRALLFASLA